MLSPLIKRFFILGVPIDHVEDTDMDQVILDILAKGHQSTVLFVDLQMVLKARKNPELLHIMQQAALVLPLTKNLVYGVHKIHAHPCQRYLPIDFILRMMSLMEHKSYSTYLLGSTLKIVHTADKNLRTSFPGLAFVGRHAGYFKKEEQNDIVTAIRKATPTLLLCARGLKGHHLWLEHEKEQLQFKVGVYIADSFDIFANKKPKTDSKDFETGMDRWKLVMDHPLRIFHIFHHIHYHFLLLFKRFH